MRDWGPWDWIAYSGLGLSTLGLAFAQIVSGSPTISAGLPDLFRSDKWNYFPACLLVLSTIVLLVKEIVRSPNTTLGQLKSGTTKAVAEPEPQLVAIPTFNLDTSKLTRITGRKFEYETVILDGFLYADCSFNCVTFQFEGTSVYGIYNCTFFTGGTLPTATFKSANPVIIQTLQLFHLVSNVGGSQSIRTLEVRS
jgi:hypothetical protein